ncbi:MAG TPA: hypothetical protein VFC56_16790 [Stellaceae bacterium]|nr:hypothetical protein [Stellaceae bacterium]
MSVREAIASGRCRGFICAAAFRIEAIRKQLRVTYFTQPYMHVRHEIVTKAGHPHLKWSFGPDDSRHPRIHPKQAIKFQNALRHGVLLMRGQNWMGLPSPPEIDEPSLYITEEASERFQREQRQLDVSALIDERGVGQSAFANIGGRSGRPVRGANEKRLQKACAEWADGELVAAHIAYQNDVLCTDDRGRSAGRSILDDANRKWLTAEHGVVFRSVDQLMDDLTKDAEGIR